MALKAVGITPKPTNGAQIERKVILSSAVFALLYLIQHCDVLKWLFMQGANLGPVFSGFDTTFDFRHICDANIMPRRLRESKLEPTGPAGQIVTGPWDLGSLIFGCPLIYIILHSLAALYAEVCIE